MYSYMEYVQKCFNKSTNWNEDNIYENITQTSQALLQFNIPSGININISSKSSDYTHTSLSLSNYGAIHGSIAYLYSSCPLNNVVGTKLISLQDAVTGFKIVDNYNYRTVPAFSTDSKTSSNNNTLLYGRMYFPGSALEAMIIKRFGLYNQLIVKCVSNENLKNNGIVTLYYQLNKPRFSREFIFSTNEALLGFRCLFNFNSSTESKQKMFAKFNNSLLSVGTEVWYGVLNMSPGLSTALRYTTQSTLTGKPLTMTLACNPILGDLSSSYTVKTSVCSTFASSYDFNIYSYKSNLCLGFELYNYDKSKNPSLSLVTPSIDLRDEDTEQITTHFAESEDTKTLKDTRESEMKRKSKAKSKARQEELQSLHNSQPIHTSNETDVIRNFQKLVNDSNFSSVIKMNLNLLHKNFKVIWMGKLKDFLICFGLNFNVEKNYPEVAKIGLSFEYSS